MDVRRGIYPHWFLAAMLVASPCSCLLASSSYTVRPKDTLSNIARANKVTVEEILAINRIPDPDWLQVGQVLALPPSADADTIYTVKKGDALSAIAHWHGISTQTLIAYNKLRSPDRLNIGDTLRIPPSRQTSTPAHTYLLPKSLERLLNQPRVKARRWRNIVIHHSGTNRGTLRGMDRYHREERRMENGLAYHFIIGYGSGMPDGQIEAGDRWKRQLDGGHLASCRLNHQSIGICLVGNFDQRKPTTKQIESLHALCTYLTRRCRLHQSRIKTHTQINPRPTKCPGRHFDYAAFIADFHP